MLEKTITKKGFCRGCVQNIIQLRRIRSPFWFACDKLTLQLSSLIGIGPWQCPHCGSRKLKLAKPVSGVRDFEEDHYHDQVVEDELPQGNYLFGVNSMIHTRDNEERFSRKFRDGVALRLLNGSASVSQASRDINVSEKDLLRWINELVIEQQQWMAEEIQHLKTALTDSVGELDSLDDTPRQIRRLAGTGRPFSSNSSG